jgi:hypothetical protein
MNTQAVNILDVTLTDETKGHMFNRWSEECGSISGLFAYLQREYGRCRSKMYRETPDGDIPCGWYFEKTDHYSDTDEPYTRGAWCSVRTIQSWPLD